MIRFILVAASVIFYLILSIPVLIFENMAGKKNLRASDERSISNVRWIFKIILFFAGVKITVKGKEKIPVDQAVLYVGNHRSYFDILVGYTTVPGWLDLWQKKRWKKSRCSRLDEACKLPVFGQTECKRRVKNHSPGIEQVKSGVSVWIFPEGTRNTNDDIMELLPFKEGSLKIAEKSGCPVVPVAITGTAEVFEKHLPFIRSSKVTIEFGEPFLVKELEPESKKSPVLM